MATPYQERKVSDPVMNVGDEPYFEAAAQGRLLIKKCGDCGEIHFHPRGICPFCLSDKVSWQDAKGTGKTAEDTAKPLTPSQLGTDAKKLFGTVVSSFSSPAPESEPFTGEPQRDSMTAPPTGYQTPSPNYPYGMGIQQDKRKASTLEDRLEPAK